MSKTVKFSLLSLISFLVLLPMESGFAQIGKWETLPNAPVSSSRMDDIYFVSPSVGWVVSNTAGELYKTTDGGDSWTLQVTLPEYLRSLGFSNAMNGWVGTVFDASQVLYHTTDGGANWNVVTNIPVTSAPQGICGISVVNDTVMYGSGRFYGPARMTKTTNNGASWTNINLSAYAGALVDCYFWSPDSGLVVGGSNSDYTIGVARVLGTTNGGATWTYRYSGIRPGELGWKIHFISKQVGYVSIETFQAGPTYYLKTTDGGLTWNDQLFQNFEYDVQGIGFVSQSHGWLGGWGGDTYETKDGGASWQLAGFGYIVNRFRFINDTCAYSVGETVYKYSPCPGVGDANASGYYTLADIISAANYLFNKPGCSPGPLCWLSNLLCRGDWNGNGKVQLDDIIRGVNFVLGKPGGPWNPLASGTCCLP